MGFAWDMFLWLGMVLLLRGGVLGLIVVVGLGFDRCCVS